MYKETGTLWEDLRFAAGAVRTAGGGVGAAVEAATGLLLFTNVGTRTVAGAAQMPHGWFEGSSIEPHVHWTKTSSAGGDVFWNLVYDVASPGEVLPFTYASGPLASETPVVSDGDTAGQHAITSLGTLSMTGKTLSTFIVWQLSRIPASESSTYAASARMLGIDFHFRNNTRGSGKEFFKD